MSEFFHLTPGSMGAKNRIPLEVGTLLCTSDHSTNPYFESVMDFHHVLPIDGIAHPILEVLRSPTVVRFTSNEIASNSAHIIESHFKAIREYEFEEIRRVEFPSRPSRMKCLWLTDRESAKYWRTRLDATQNARLLRVSASGKIHMANEGHLTVEVQSISGLRDAARAYWRGDSHHRGKSELLLEGEMTVLEILDW